MVGTKKRSMVQQTGAMYKAVMSTPEANRIASYIQLKNNPFKSKEPLDWQISQVTGQMVAPDVFPARRMCDDYSGIATAVAKPHQEFKWNWNPNIVNTGLQLSADQVMLVLTRDALRHMIVYFQQVAGGTSGGWKYFSVFNPSDNSTSASGGMDRQLIKQNSTTPLRPIYMAVDPSLLNNGQPHGPEQYNGYSTARGSPTTFWVDSTPNKASLGVTVTMNRALTAAAPIESAFLNVYRYNISGLELITGSLSLGEGTLAPIPFTNTAPVTGFAQATFLPNSAGPLPAGTAFGSNYYGFEVNYTTNNATNASPPLQARITYQNPADSSCFAHLPLGNLAPNKQNVAAIRVPAAKVLIKDEASGLVKQGMWVACMIGENEDWFYGYAQPQGGPMTTLLQNVQEKPLLMKDGYDGWLKPGGQSDFAWQKCIKTGKAGITVGDSTWPLDDIAPFLMVAGSCTSAGGGDCWVSEWASVEYQTHNSWLDVLPPDLEADAWRLGVMACATLPNNLPNGTHWSTIMSWVSSIANGLAPIAANIPHAAGPAAAAALAGVGFVAGKFGTQEKNL